jgi:2'-5' RNA ligase
METIRAFIAVELPDSVKLSLKQITTNLKKTELTGIKWVDPGSVHLTLKFLGNIEPGTISALEEKIRQVAEANKLFYLETGEPGAFPDAKAPRVLWVGLRGDLDNLRKLQREIESILVPMGFPKEKRSFSPHLTLARTRDRASPLERRHLGNALSSSGNPEAVQFRIDCLSLMKSTLTKEGALYHCLVSIPLKGA